LTPALLLCSDVTHHPATGLLCTSRFHFRMNDFFFDGILRKATNKCRRKLIGLTGSVSGGIFKEFCLLNRIICLFPRWYHTHEIPDNYPLLSKTSRVTQTNFPSTTKSISWCKEEDISDPLKLGIEESIFARHPKTIIVVVSGQSRDIRKIFQVYHRRRINIAYIDVKVFGYMFDEISRTVAEEEKRKHR